MRGTTSYDGNLQMFCEPVHEVDLARLRFVRWLVEHRQLEHPVFGEPAGEYAGEHGGRLDEDTDFQALLAQDAS